MKKDKPYRVRWEIDIYAKSAREAAKIALTIQRNPNSTALFFDVTDDVGSICPTGWKEYRV